MKISIHFRSPAAAVATRGPYDMEPAEWDRLKKDFLSFVEQGTPKGGAYRATDLLLEERSTELVLKFEEIVYIA
jgi:hypothetical protein